MWVFGLPVARSNSRLITARMKRKPPPAPVKRGRGRPEGAIKTAPLNVRVPISDLAHFDTLRGDVSPGYYVGLLIRKEAKRKKLT